MERVSVVGNSGSGKSTFGAALAARLDVRHVELDAIFHQPGWQELPQAEFRARVALHTERSGWVVDGNYAQVQDLVWATADTVVWLDLPRRIVMRRVVGRTLSRLLGRRELWNGNREPWRNLWSRDPERSIIAWSWAQHGTYQARYAGAMADPAHARLRIVRLRSPRAVRRFLAGWTTAEN